jgi:uncharacterized protein (UPF0548 family)
MFRLAKPSFEECDRLLALATRQALSYPEMGATRTGELPGGYRHDRNSLTLGPVSLFESAAEQLLQWRAQKGAGSEVIPDDRIASEGSNYLVLIKLGFVWTIAPVRIIYLVDQPDLKGFGYGTLPGHPETGEECFVIERRDDQTQFHITAFSKPSERLVRLGQPIARAVQSHTTRRYLQALKPEAQPGPASRS